MTIGITLFAFSTILGWEYHGKKHLNICWERTGLIWYTALFFLCCVFRMYTDTESGMEFSDIANALMAIPNLICMLLLSGEIAKDIREFQKEIHKYN